MSTSQIKILTFCGAAAATIQCVIGCVVFLMVAPDTIMGTIYTATVTISAAIFLILNCVTFFLRKRFADNAVFLKAIRYGSTAGFWINLVWVIWGVVIVAMQMIGPGVCGPKYCNHDSVMSLSVIIGIVCYIFIPCCGMGKSFKPANLEKYNVPENLEKYNVLV